MKPLISNSVIKFDFNLYLCEKKIMDIQTKNRDVYKEKPSNLNYFVPSEENVLKCSVLFLESKF